MTDIETNGAERGRRDGWHAQRRQVFLQALSETGSVRDACARVRMSRSSAYALRRRSGAFERAWDDALALIVPTIEQAAYVRAVEGWEEPVWHGGKIVGQRRRFSDSLLRMLLQRHGKDAADEKENPYRATQAETDAMLKKRLREQKLRREREQAREREREKALPASDEPRRDEPDTGGGDAGSDDRGTAGGVRHGHGPRIWTFS